MEKKPSTISMLTPVSSLSNVSLQHKYSVNKLVFPMHLEYLVLLRIVCSLCKTPFLVLYLNWLHSAPFINIKCDQVAVNARQNKKVKTFLSVWNNKHNICIMPQTVWLNREPHTCSCGHFCLSSGVLDFALKPLGTSPLCFEADGIFSDFGLPSCLLAL